MEGSIHGVSRPLPRASPPRNCGLGRIRPPFGSPREGQPNPTPAFSDDPSPLGSGPCFPVRSEARGDATERRHRLAHLDRLRRHPHDFTLACRTACAAPACCLPRPAAPARFVSPLAPLITSILPGPLKSNCKRDRRCCSRGKGNAAQRQRRLLFLEAWEGGGAQLAPLGFPLFSLEAPRLRDPDHVR